MPFDLSVHPPQTIVDVLENDFSDYSEPSRLTYDETRRHMTDVGRQILWNHDIGPQWAENNFSTFREAYARRIGNFRSALTDGRPTLCVLYLDHYYARDARNPDERTSTISRIVDAIQRIGTNPVTLVCLVSVLGREAVGDAVPIHTENFGANRVLFHEVPLPHETYRWWHFEDFATSEGLVHDLTIMDGIHRGLETLYK